MRGTHPAIIVGELLSTTPRLRTICEDARRLGHLEAWLLAQLDVALRPHCRLTVDRRCVGTLVLQVDSAAWATRVRYVLPALQRQLCRLPEAADVRGLDVKVRPAAAPGTILPAARRARLPAEAAEALRSTAAAIDHPALKGALLRLSRRAR
jgi:hypothetical protein